MEEQFTKGFFEFIAAADAEKVHSQTIGWMFSNDCDVFNDNEKNLILKELVFGDPKQKIDLTPNNVSVEINDIDILITCGDRLVVIENKIKSSQHSNQLFKYEYLTAGDEKLAWQSYFQWKFQEECNKIRSQVNGDYKRFLEAIDERQKSNDFNWNPDKQGKIPYYIYLTLIEEEPLGSKGRWNMLSYSRLHEVLSTYLSNKKHQDTENFWIVKSYVRTIQNLSKVANSFIQKPQDFKFVFTVGKQAIERINTNDLQDSSPQSYIKLLRLETLLQKWFYSNLLERIKIKEEDEGLLDYKKCIIGETNGTALFDFHFNKITIDNKIYTSILQFQSNAIKLALAGDSDKEKPDDSDKKELITQRKDIFVEKLKNSDTFNQLKNIEIKLSTPKKSEGFISININQKSEDDRFWQFYENPHEFVFKKIKLAQEIFQEING